MARKNARAAIVETSVESELFGDTVDKFANAAMQFAVTQATHNQRLNGIDAIVRHLQDDIRTMRDVQQDNHKSVNERVDNLSNHLNTRMDTLDTRMDKLDTKLDTQTVTLTRHIDEGMEGIRTRLKSVEVWRYVILGGAAVVVFIIGDLFVRMFGDIALDVFKQSVVK